MEQNYPTVEQLEVYWKIYNSSFSTTRKSETVLDYYANYVINPTRVFQEDDYLFLHDPVKPNWEKEGF